MSTFLPGIHRSVPAHLCTDRLPDYCIDVHHRSETTRGSPATARSGNQLASLAMFIGVIVTLFDREIISFEYIIIGVIVGTAIGALLAKRVEMTSMPELVAVFNGFGGAASALVAAGEYLRIAEVNLPGSDLFIMCISIFHRFGDLHRIADCLCQTQRQNIR